MKSQLVYSELRDRLNPLFKANGFKRSKTMLSWVRPHRELFLGAWCQVSHDGWDEYAGSKFVVEFQAGHEPTIGCSIRRARIGKLLSDSDRETIRAIQNNVIAKLTRPHKDHGLLHAGEDIRACYLKKFDPVERPYQQSDDIWFRYGSQEDVAMWAQFLIAKLPEVFKQIETWA
jgi:hypothetical protein